VQIVDEGTYLGAVGVEQGGCYGTALGRCGAGVGIAELLAACFRDGEGILGTGANGFALMLGNGGKNVQGQSVRVGHVACYKIHAAIHQVGNKGDVTRQTVEFGDDQAGAFLPAEGEGLGDLWAVVLRAAFHLGELSDDFPSALGVAGHGSALCVKPQAALTLTVGGYPVVGDILHRGIVQRGCKNGKRTFDGFMVLLDILESAVVVQVRPSMARQLGLLEHELLIVQ